MKPGVWGFGRKRKGSWSSATSIHRALLAHLCLHCLHCKGGHTTSALARKKNVNVSHEFITVLGVDEPRVRAALVKIV